MSDLFYAVIALKSDEVDQVVTKLEAQKLDVIARWLELRKEVLYGKRNEDWKPFDNLSISQLVNETKGYQTATNLIDALDDKVSNIAIVRKSPISIYFIDAFAIYLDKYVNLAEKVDYHAADNAKCCLVMSYDLPVEMQEQLIIRYCSVWTQVCTSYREGNLHRIAVRPDDLKNFRNYLLKLFGQEDAPTPVANRELNNKWNFHTKQPPSFATT